MDWIAVRPKRMIGRPDHSDQAKCNEQRAGGAVVLPTRPRCELESPSTAGWLLARPELSAKLPTYLPTYLPGRSAISLGTAHIRNGFEFSRLVFDSY